jgi:hypothetical protein
MYSTAFAYSLPESESAEPQLQLGVRDESKSDVVSSSVERSQRKAFCTALPSSSTQDCDPIAISHLVEVNFKVEEHNKTPNKATIESSEMRKSNVSQILGLHHCFTQQ